MLHAVKLKPPIQAVRLAVLPGFTRKRVHHGIAQTATVLALCWAAVLPVQAKQDDLVVKIESGLAHGAHSADYPNVECFLGIPYAAPPCWCTAVETSATSSPLGLACAKLMA